jgi:hypothetical protein
MNKQFIRLTQAFRNCKNELKHRKRQNYGDIRKLDKGKYEDDSLLGYNTV